MTHAIIEKDGFKVPLIGIPMASTLETCGCCGDEFPMMLVRFTGNGFVCVKCDGEPNG